MTKPMFIPVIETEKEILKIIKSSAPFLTPRLKMLLAMKKAGDDGITKKELQEATGSCSQSIQTWRTAYKQGGIQGLISHKKIGYKPSSFTPEEDKQLEELMKNPKNNIKGYKELNEWVKKELNKEIKYNTLLKYMISKFNTSIKVARKSHVKKNDDEVEAFKKNSIESAKKQLKKIQKNTNR